MPEHSSYQFKTQCLQLHFGGQGFAEFLASKGFKNKVLLKSGQADSAKPKRYGRGDCSC